MTDTEGPRTEAGKRLLANLEHGGDRGPTREERKADRDDILAIEAEARADVDGLVARLERYIAGPPEIWETVCSDITAILAGDTPEALLAGDKAEAPTWTLESLEADAFKARWAGDKAEAPPKPTEFVHSDWEKGDID